LWVATTVLKHRRRRLRNTEGCQILAIHRLDEHRIRGSLLAFLHLHRTDIQNQAHEMDRRRPMSCLALKSYNAPLHHRQNHRSYGLMRGLSPRRASFFCHMAIPLLPSGKSKCTSSEQPSDMFSAAVPFEHGDRKRLVVAICLRICMSSTSLHSPADLACSSAAASFELVSAC
jgi:hypothetical protein